MRKRWIVAWLLLFAAGCFCAAAEISPHTSRCGNATYQYLLYSEPHTRPAPAILLLHGAGDHATNFIDNWTHLAHKQGIVLVTPEIPREIKFEPVAPQVFRCIMDDARQAILIDPKRIYLFGHSMGGYLGFDTAMFDSEYFAAAAIHGSDIADDYVSILKEAKRKIPLAIYIGDNDQYSSLAHLHKTRDLLNHDGFPVRYVEIVGHDHNYYRVAEQVNKDAWKFFEGQSLPDK